MGEQTFDAARETVILVNPNARGGHNDRAIRRIAAIVNESAKPARVIETQSAADADRELRELPQGSKVIVAGGDGTVNSVLAAVIEKHHALGVLPLGSGNDAARALGTYDVDFATTLKRLLTTHTFHPVDVGRAHFSGQTRYFFVALNAGFDASIAARAMNGPKWLRGLPRYLFATVRELIAIQHWGIELSLDDELHFAGDALFASVLNAPTFGSGMPAVPHARIDDEKLDVLIARRFTRSGALVMLPRLLRGTHLNDSRITTRSFSTMRLMSETPIPIAADGEYLGETRTLAIDVNSHLLWAIR